MGRCKYCGEPAGFLHGRHKQCHVKYREGAKQLVSLLQRCFGEPALMETLGATIKEITTRCRISDSAIRSIVPPVWRKLVERAFEDKVVTQIEENCLTAIAQECGLGQQELDHNGSWTKLARGAILREVMEGRIPDKVRVDGPIPFNFQKQETLIWLFQHVKYFEQKTRRRYEGGSSGVSVRIAKGVYLRSSAFKGRAVDYTETASLGTGILAVTNKHLYFAGPEKTFRISHDKIVAITPHSDGVSIQRDGVTAKPQLFITNDGWFTYNLLVNMGALQ